MSRKNQSFFQSRTINHNGIKAICTMENGSYIVRVGNQKIGEFVFSDGYNGARGFSNSFGTDAYLFTRLANDKPAWGMGPLHSSVRSAVVGVIEHAQKAGAL